jgi:hypothetical protein|tara:strand:- start:740 stop:949 length:210 start_codon:yes stop_codon:yes gene_type:complete
LNYEKSYTVPQVEKILGLEKSVIYRKIREGEINCTDNKPISIKRSSLCSYVLERAPHAWHIWRDDPIGV